MINYYSLKSIEHRHRRNTILDYKKNGMNSIETYTHISCATIKQLFTVSTI